MGYVDPSQQDPNQNQNQSQVDQALQGNQSQASSAQQTQPDSTPPATSGGGGSGVVSGGGVGGTAASSGTASTNANKPSTSGSWTNLNQYIDANKDQGSGIGDQIANTINNQGQTAQQESTDLSNKFTGEVQANTVQENSDAVQKAVNDASSMAVGGSLSQDEMNSFAQQALAKYNGPTDFTHYGNYDQAAQDAANAGIAATQSQSEAGRDVLLKNQFQNASQNGYTQGENNLDQLLLEGSGGANTVNQAAQQWSGLSNTLNGLATTNNAAAAQALAQTQKTAADANSYFNNTRNTQSQAVENYLANQQANYGTEYNNLINTLNAYNASGNLNVNAAQANMLGLKQGEGLFDLYQAAPQLGSQYVTQEAFDANRQITPQQQAQLAALDKLGSAANIAGTNRYTNAALAGTQNSHDSINTQNFQQAVKNAQQSFLDYEKTNFSAQGSASNPYGQSWQINNPFGGTVASGFYKYGDANATAAANQTLEQYLANNNAGVDSQGNYATDPAGLAGIALTPAGLTGALGITSVMPQLGLGGNYNDVMGRTQSQANEQARQGLWSQLQAAIKSSGYGNAVNIS